MTPTTANLTALLVLLALVFIALIPLARWVLDLARTGGAL